MNGRFIYRTEIKGISIQVDLSSYPTGVYFITIRSKGHVSTKKLIKLG